MLDNIKARMKALLANVALLSKAIYPDKQDVYQNNFENFLELLGDTKFAVAIKPLSEHD